MERSYSRVELGNLICRHCGDIVGTLDTEKVINYYVECGKEGCSGGRSEEEGNSPAGTGIAADVKNVEQTVSGF
ncbi:GapA-binding peptide SR1P [Paenibacillus thalictri]|uniref:GapA-binding peptide SR1P n=1 Tax=Paenibacillus thalictri TaxID=2527873 RepID=A0A4Q9DT84_9BACL|nr:GapA-binding peptide SR1P [Paenibacillus thalictri]TBL79476.1 GapA-binding peptide SR1P [Paenibacillus thalictri]